MRILASQLVSSLILATSFARADVVSSEDLRYCLELQSNNDIAKCAGEISAGNKGTPLSKQEIDEILSRERASAPVRTIESPAPEMPGKETLPEQVEGDSE